MASRTGPRSALLWTYDADQPSFRHRVSGLAAELERRGWCCNVEILPRGRYVRRILERRSGLRAADLLLVHRIKLSFLEFAMLRRAARRIVFDVDDALYVRQPRRIGEEARGSWVRRTKFLRTCAISDLVLAGNRALARAAAASAARVEHVPTPVDLGAYTRAATPRDPHTLAWIGLPENLLYLELIRPVIARLATEFTDLRLRVISSEFPVWPEARVEAVPWSVDVEATALCGAGIGVMPLSDDAWTRGKCAFKLLQYMAAALPCVSSAVGASLDIVEDGVCGELARDAEGWERALRRLMRDPDAAARMGRAARERVREHYDVDVVASRAADILEDLLRG